MNLVPESRSLAGLAGLTDLADSLVDCLAGLIGHSILHQHLQELLVKGSRTWAFRVIKEAIPCDGGIAFSWHTEPIPAPVFGGKLAKGAQSRMLAQGLIATGIEFIALDDSDLSSDDDPTSDYDSPDRMPLILRHEMIFDSYTTLARL